MVRKIIFYENHFIEFYKSQDDKVKVKIQYVLELIKQVEGVPEKFLSIFQVRMAFMKSGLNINLISTGYSVASMKVN